MTEQARTHLELYNRSSVPHPIAERLSSLQTELSSIADEQGWSFEVTQWPAHVELSHTKGSAVEHVYERLQAWAQRAEVSLDPAFERRQCYSWETGERYEALVLPVACLAVRRGGEPLAVYPHRDASGIHTIPDVIERLQEGNLPEYVSDRSTESRVTEPDHALELQP